MSKGNKRMRPTAKLRNGKLVTWIAEITGWGIECCHESPFSSLYLLGPVSLILSYYRLALLSGGKQQINKNHCLDIAFYIVFVIKE